MLAFVFASFLALVPLLMALLDHDHLPAARHRHDWSPIVQFLIALIGLGVAIDYSLLVVSLAREHARAQRGGGARSMETAGRAVIFSGITVAIGLALVALPLPFLRSMGYGGLLIPLVSTLAAITLLPVVLAKLGPRLDWPHRRTDDGRAGLDPLGHRNHPPQPLGGGGSRIGCVLALSLAATDIQLGSSDANTIAKSGEAKEGLDALEDSGIGESCCRTRSWSIAAPTPKAVARSWSRPPASTALSRPTRRTGVATRPPSSRWCRFPTAVPTRARRTWRRLSAAHGAGPDVAVVSRPPTPTSSTPSTAASR